MNYKWRKLVPDVIKPIVTGPEATNGQAGTRPSGTADTPVTVTMVIYYHTNLGLLTGTHIKCDSS